VVIFAGFAIASAREGERRATRVSLLFAVGGAVVFALAIAAPVGVREIVVGCVAVAVVAAAGLFLWPIGKVEAVPRAPEAQIDERDIMFSRFDVLAPGMPHYEAYYAAHPEEKISDDRTRTLPGLLSPGSLLANPLAFAAAGAGFHFTMALAGELDGPPAGDPEPVDPIAMTPYLKALARYWGAYRYWWSVGTDSGRCMAECPYSHPDTFWHDTVRAVGTRSGAARRVALHLDDLFYGRKPAPRPAPSWIPARRPRR
jgi:hypothetical protein